MMLKSLDILIGLSFIMLILSMVVTALSQFVLSLLNTRGRRLRSTLADLLESHGMLRPHAKEVSAALLSHPLVRGNLNRLGGVIRREEFEQLLRLVSKGEAPMKEQTWFGAVTNQVRGRYLTERGVEALKKMFAKNPPGSDDLAASFDRAMDRVSDRFTYNARVVTIACAAAVAVFLQVDTLGIVNRLWLDDSLRQALVERASEAVSGGESEVEGAFDPADPSQTGVKSVARGTDEAQAAYSSFLADNGLLAFPGFADFPARLKQTRQLPGILISTLLLSMGAPFWFAWVKSLIRLRSALAEKEEKEREERAQKTKKRRE